jgi:hypothetical protein
MPRQDSKRVIRVKFPIFSRCENYLFLAFAPGGPGSSVGIATDYGLDGPGIESRWGGARFSARPYWPWGPIQPPVQWVPGLSRG